MIRRRYPKTELFGFDISDQTLTTARAKLGQRVLLANGDACRFIPVATFGEEIFDNTVLSYSLSRIPD
ncbi:class I SAM-dependent methyltransferase [Ruegeria sp. Ofav3-42]|uniref:class I SAM-dependent methyltransferase n=1 Tax=Ruegeria sp. Ofav3-42 TaxID=2917759 RepID=UPI001EF582B1|nr:class I SAM-dependent methyltransferase [Ruegeria sp. Ofav3-42]MCG7522636.1 class I SAM-dependent methyltransferase [Ruegeria sp. Ofav3-42]